MTSSYQVNGDFPYGLLPTTSVNLAASAHRAGCLSRGVLIFLLTAWVADITRSLTQQSPHEPVESGCW